MSTDSCHQRWESWSDCGVKSGLAEFTPPAMRQTPNGKYLDKVPKSDREEERKALNRIWYSSDEKTALENGKDFVNKYGKKYEVATGCFVECLSDCLTFFRFPEKYWVHIRTSNLLERTFREVRRRIKVIGRFPTESSALAVIFGILTIDSPNRWDTKPFSTHLWDATNGNLLNAS